MSYRLDCQLAGWGSVQNPLDSEERIPVEDGQVVVDDKELADTLAAEYKRLVLADDSSAASETEPTKTEDEQTDDEVADPPIDPGEYTVDELETHLDENDYDDAELRAIGDAERSADDRTGALDAIEAAREDKGDE